MDTAILDKTIKEVYATDAAIPNSHNLYCAITEQLQKYADLKEVLIRMWQLEMACIIPPALPENWYYPKQIARKFKTA
jgi:hypothetical protein